MTTAAAADAIEKEPGPWVAFERLEAALGRTTFIDVIREALRPASSAAIPPTYPLLWQLRPAGVLNLNLDKLATRAYYEVNGSRHLTEFNSNNVGSNTIALQGLHPFVYNLHGTHEDSNSWVLTHDRLQMLRRDQGYKNFIAGVLSTHVVVFLGLSAEDVAVGGHLERLAVAGIDTGPHYWLSSRADLATDKWAEANGIRLIPYRTTDGSHTELTELLEDLVRFVPPESVPGVLPVVADIASPLPVLPGPAELARKDAPTIRAALNNHANSLLARDTRDEFRAFEAFVKEYDEAVHGAWYVSLSPGHNDLFGYSLIEEVAKGAFGRVFKATAADGAFVAVKLLHNNLREHHELLLAFRRGVRSMRILHDHGLIGVVNYREASEIPAMVVMDWVEGANLNNAVMSGGLAEWRQVLTVAVALARIINRAHSLPERVLHRDIRPSNVMIDGFWSGDDWKVVVLDFDLSWHRGAYEQSVTYGSGTAGYLAPEQIVVHKDESARHAAVDSFGIGMTLFFIAGRADPLPAQHRHDNWLESLEQASNRVRPCDWRSLPRRYARLVAMSTRDRQAERLDLSQILAELERMLTAVATPENLAAADVVAEELAARAAYLQDYRWDEDSLTASVQRPTGLTCRLAGDLAKSQVSLVIEWTNLGNDVWKRVNKKLPDASRAAHEALEKAGWHCETPSIRNQHMAVSGVVSARAASVHLDQLAGGIDRALSCLRVD
jgi:hypothetical protein